MEIINYWRQVAREMRRVLQADIENGNCPGGQTGLAAFVVFRSIHLIEKESERKEAYDTKKLLEKNESDKT